jgi:serine/threonine-protein kinase
MLRDIRESLADLGEDVKSTVDEGLLNAPPAMEDDGDEMQATRVKPRKRRGLGWLKWLVPLVVVAVAGAWGSVELMDWLNVPTIQMPGVVGKSLSDAQEELRVQGLLGSVVAQKYDDKTPVGYVISQMPEAGESVKKGRTVNLVVSLGQESTIVPDITNKPLREAEVLLHGAGLDFGSIRGGFHPTIPEDSVTSQNPRKDTRVAKGTLVDVFISKGPEPTAISVPDFVGSSVQDAVQLLAGLKLAQGTITEKDSPDPAGLVIGQDPQKGSEVRAGTPVNLIVSRGPGSLSSRRNVISISIPDGNNQVDLKVTVQDGSGTRLAYRGKHDPRATVQVEVYWNGPQATVRIFFDDVQDRELTLN